MKQAEIHELAKQGMYHGEPLKGKIEETHISWVILSRKHVFKIKKPVKLSFLDFSTLTKRKHFCEREIKLNEQYTDIYLSTLPIRFQKNSWYIGGRKGKLIDYAVLMKRMASAKRMDKVLLGSGATEYNIRALAKVIASFHQKARKIRSPFSLPVAIGLFNEIVKTKPFVVQKLGQEHTNTLTKSIEWSNDFLEAHKKRMQQRIDHGFKRDVHGDLHSGNIFLYKKPVLFDCIEFNDAFRQIDLLYEIAFLCMDLESFGEKRFADSFLAEYNRLLPCIEIKEDEHIFNYFKCLRANVRAKVNLMSATQADDDQELAHHLADAEKYFKLMNHYMAAGSSCP
ncbi:MULTISPECIES: phosphotransferase [unclassified Imperialibacter]|uniref:phosphotransferase n=1 Tax=unclassified Imperialibacter TaxID=2629706 RepID=UPI0012534D20|nr:MULTISPECIES: hypothetical protein [unclassified Imperialibacter]CAD5265137.1 conserved hypothetical protein [Imperialibacter sp. 89]CAD5270030.1 conserved hypothetical protein [Imperialibacter sp. 75]VVT09635.1 conserved hypothetical protein [Imperialibacter sp. EC-SDR9]